MGVLPHPADGSHRFFSECCCVLACFPASKQCHVDGVCLGAVAAACERLQPSVVVRIVDT